MSALRERVWFASCLALLGAAVCALTFAARSGATPSTIAIGLTASFIPYVGVLVFSRSIEGSRVSRWLALVCALVFGGVFVLGPPALSDDLYRYLWEGRVWLEGINPYRVAPEDPSLAHIRDGLWVPINNKPLASIYPPLSQSFFIVAALLGGQVWSIKLLALLTHVLGVFVVGRLSDEPRPALTLGLNPLLLSESALNGHFDILVGTALLVAVWAMARHRFVRAGVAICAAVGLKIVGIVVLPLMWPRRRALLATAFGSGALLAPLAVSRALDDPASGTGQFAARWRGNESLFALVDWVCRHLLEDRAEMVARASVIIALTAVIAVAVHRRVPPLRAGRAVIWAVLLLSPQVHPWYLAWLLPLELAAGARAGLVWSAAVLCAYAPLDRWVADGVWEMPLWLQVFEYSVVALALIFDSRRPSLSKAGSSDQFERNSEELT